MRLSQCFPKSPHPDNPRTAIPGPRHSHVWVSLSGRLKEIPRRNILERVQATPDGREGLRALRKVSASSTDRTQQVFFQAGEGFNLGTFKAKGD